MNCPDPSKSTAMNGTVLIESQVTHSHTVQMPWSCSYALFCGYCLIAVFHPNYSFSVILDGIIFPHFGALVDTERYINISLKLVFIRGHMEQNSLVRIHCNDWGDTGNHLLSSELLLASCIHITKAHMGSVEHCLTCWYHTTGRDKRLHSHFGVCGEDLESRI